MSNGWPVKQIGSQAPQVIAGIVTNLPITNVNGTALSAGGALYGVVKITAADVTVAGSITATLETAIGDDWEDSGYSATVTADGVFYIVWNSNDPLQAPDLPLLNRARVVLSTTDADDEVTISRVDFLQQS